MPYLNNDTDYNYYTKVVALVNQKSISRDARLSAAHACNLLPCLQGILLCKKLSDDQVAV